jgi:hypothetical protein
MAYDAEFARVGALAQVIYVWPSRELTSRSWSWPGGWHEAFQDAASRLGLAVALYDLDGRRFTRRLVELQVSVGTVAFRVKRRGASIFVTVSGFTASVSPRPDGPNGTRQPRAADGLVLGLHGSARGVYLAVFYGQMPPVPVGASRAGSQRRRHVVPVGSVSPAKTGTASGMPHRGAKARKSTDTQGDIRAGSRRKADGKISSAEPAGPAAVQRKGQWSAIVWRTHTGSLAILPLHKKARVQRWPAMDLFGHAQSRLLH